MDKSALVDKIKLLEGLTNDEKADLIGLLRSHKKYGLVWEEKAEDVEERLREQLPVLTEVKERAIVSNDADVPNHILIEGDNLEALTALSYSHEGKIDVIYIDPPYNTGNKDFVYNDSYVDSEDSYRHSKWLSFMHKRLKIAKRLLSDEGVIFISIDDNEQANIKLLCDEIFGEHNFTAQLIWEQGRKSMAAQVAINHEYCLIYCKNKTRRIFFDNNIKNNNWKEKKEGLNEIYKECERLEKIYGNHYQMIEKGIRMFYKNLPENHPSKRQSQYKCYDKKGLYFPGDIAQGTGNGGRFDIIHPLTEKPCKLPKGGWRFSIEKLPQLLKEDKIHFGEDETKVPCLKRYLKETEYEIVSSVFYKDGRGATKRLDTLFGENVFEHPKDENIISKFLSLVTSYDKKETFYILDFFAGSGTTLHATMQLNAEDGGNRQCILVTNNENKICEEVTYERNKRVINGYTTPKGEHIEGLKRNTLRYYQTELLPREHSPKNMRELMSKATDLLCIKEDLYTEQQMFGRYKTHPKALRYFADAQKQMLILYREEFIPEIVEEIKGMDFDGKKLKVYLYSPGHYAFEDDFFEVQDKVELIALPSAIYKAYKEVLPKAKDKLIELANEETTEGGTL